MRPFVPLVAFAAGVLSALALPALPLAMVQTRTLNIDPGSSTF